MHDFIRNALDVIMALFLGVVSITMVVLSVMGGVRLSVREPPLLWTEWLMLIGCIFAVVGLFIVQILLGYLLIRGTYRRITGFVEGS